MRLWTLSVCAATRRRCFPILINLLSPRLASWKNLKSWSCRQLQAAERQRQLRWHHQETAQRGMRACPANCGDKHQKGRRQSTSKKREIARRCQSEARTQWLNPPWQKGSLSISSLNKSFFFAGLSLTPPLEVNAIDVFVFAYFPAENIYCIASMTARQRIRVVNWESWEFDRLWNLPEFPALHCRFSLYAFPPKNL